MTGKLGIDFRNISCGPVDAEIEVADAGGKERIKNV
jgi:hypothetical protein